MYFLTDEEDAPYHRLFADGKIHNISFGDQGGEFPTASYGHPAYFTLGLNDGGEPNAEGDPDDFTLKADGALYLLEIEFYGEDNEYLYSCSSPFFVKGADEEEPQAEGSTVEIGNICFTYPEGMEAAGVDGHSMMEIVSGNNRLEIVVSSQEDMNGGYESVVERGTKETNAQGDTYYCQKNSFEWLFATDGGGFISMTGDGDWQSIAGAIEWSVIR